MTSNQTYYSYPSAPVPISQQPKQQQQLPYYYPSYPTQQTGLYSRLSISPPEGPDSGTTSGVASYDPSAASNSSYAGSASDYDSSASSSSGAASVDLLEYMGDRLHGAYDPIPLDRSLAQQAQTSGQLNAKTQELLQLQALARSRLAAAQASFADGIKAAKEVQRDLEWTQKRVSSINQRAAKKYPDQYARASAKYPAPVDY
ncbi:hypothetical protein EJ05DRAFT_272981 [Pseudovirgaria hyperparasitica]|uniref:Biogenesis of lysosome-related organelles complex 1 subunit KXD1 n=1 Tax=Pseudovirgaria hyperparasitica TaxID=470096 RepID=A0A6A6WG45_9PEZI|nr:uncharacterized protein EJ05DRAFT_272981 [Pseudovirgaria hyperparasitica]KAF2760111.1 hypothetical protein EJ05DRAFT_272981 [Pseudovirgaria hyperparasitica]